MLGKPKYERDDKVCFELDGTVKQGYVYIVDAYGTFFQADEPSYDVMVEERESTAIVEESTKATPSGKEGKAAVQTKPAKAAPIDESPKKSIHARLQEKKKEIAQKPGKDSPQKGVELA